MNHRLAPALLLLLAGCAVPARAPPFAVQSWGGFRRADAVAIALREWRAFGSLDDGAAVGKPERDPGLWERVGEYWWLGQDPAAPEAAWTGQHDASGRVFPPGQDGDYAWSAAFVSYVMRIAGAGARFVYAPAHFTYINAARRGEAGLRAERPDRYAPQPGDLVCEGRGSARTLTFDDLPAGRFPAHCDIVVAADATQLSVVGGNVDDAVTRRLVAVDGDGRLAEPRYFVVIRVSYDG